MAIHLAEADADVGVYALEDEYSARDRAEWAPLEPTVLQTKFARVFPVALGLDDNLDATNHDILHLHGLWQFQSRCVNRWKRRTNRPVMISPRGMLDPWALSNSRRKKKIVAAWFENRNLREADCLHALNPSEAASIRRFGLTNPIAIIPNATDIPEIAPRVASNETRTLLFLGRIHPKKGLTELVTAWATACAKEPALPKTWRLEIAGWDDGGHTRALERRVKELGLTSSVRLSGPSFGAEKDALMRRADAFILPSFSEGLPMSLLEAWAYRLPVLMTGECNLPEGFSRGAAVKITTDPAEMAEALVAALLDHDLTTMGAAGRALVEERFRWGRIAEQHLEVYNWMLRGGEAPTCVQFSET